MSVEAPAANTWDVDAIVDLARVRLRGNPGDADEGYLQAQAVAATMLIDQELDRPPADAEADPPIVEFDAGAVPALVAAAVRLTVFLVAEHDTDEPDDPDPVRLVRAQVRPWKARWGTA